MKTNTLVINKNLDQLREDLLKNSPYSLLNQDKQKILNKIFQILTKHHYENCSEYQKILNSIGFVFRDNLQNFEFPFIPARLFKEYELKSIKKNGIFKTMNSSGTSGQELSKIFLDKETASLQSKTLSKILQSFIGKSRLPMIIADSEEVLKNKHMFSARGAGILGFSVFGSDKIFALDKNMLPNEDLIAEFLERNSGHRILIFGFTFIIWQHLYKYFLKKGSFPDLSGSILVHGGGWKKLTSESVNPNVFKNSLMKNFGIAEIHDYYGMIEQTGSIYMECEFGHLHASIFSDIIIRDHFDFTEKSFGEKGMIQLLSMIPTSYPGHSILTEDEGILLGIDDCKCARKGKYFKVLGRIQNAELRGCSDTYEAEIV